MKLRIAWLAIVSALLVAGCNRGPSPEQQAQLQVLRGELDSVKKETQQASNAPSGGLLKALADQRLEILKTNQALLEQRIAAIEYGAKITIETLGTKPDPDRAKALEEELKTQEKKVAEADSKAAGTGGLIGVVAQMSVATERSSLAMLRQQYLIAKYGLATAKLTPVIEAGKPTGVPASADTGDDDKLREQVVQATLLRKQFEQQDYEKFVSLDLDFAATGLDKPARAIKGMLVLTDLFGEKKFQLRWTIDKPLAPGATFIEKGSGFKYNQFMEDHHWVLATDKQNMKVKFRVSSILYEDGSTRDFD